MFGQIAAITLTNLASLPARKGPSLIMVCGMAGVVAVLVSVVAVQQAYVSVFATTADPSKVLILSKNGRFILNSSLDLRHQNAITSAEGIRRDVHGELRIGSQTYVSLSLPGHDGFDKGVMLRGVDDGFLAMLPEFEIVEGRRFRPGLHEFVVGRQGARYISHTNIGDEITINGIKLKMVGVFDNGGDFIESSFLMDGQALRSLLGRTSVSAIVAEAENGFDEVQTSLARHTDLAFHVISEPDYYDQMIEYSLQNIGPVLNAVIVLMAVAGFASAATVMHVSVAGRSHEIATYRALGFSRIAIAASVLFEALLVGAVGGGIGTVLAIAAFDGNVVSSTDGIGGLVTEIDISFGVLARGGVWLLGILTISAALPAIRALREPLPTVLRVA